MVAAFTDTNMQQKKQSNKKKIKNAQKIPIKKFKALINF